MYWSARVQQSRAAGAGIVGMTAMSDSGDL